MKTQRNYTEHEVVASLHRKMGLRINGKQIQELERATDIGNGSKGKIDFLTKYCGYTHKYVLQFNEPQNKNYANFKSNKGFSGGDRPKGNKPTR